MRRLAIFGLVVAALGFGLRPAAAARVWLWCAQYDVWAYDCGFESLQQCLATISGVGGICRPNSYAPTPPEPAPRKRKHGRR